MNTKRCWASAAAAVLAFVPGAMGQEEGGLLRGPAVPDRVSRTLVDYGMTGEFRPIEGRPESAAVALLKLDPEAHERATAVIDARSMAVAMLLVDRIDDIKEITDAITAGERERAQEIQLRLWEAFEPERPRNPLLEPLSKALSREQSVEVERLVEEYWDAWTRWELRGRPVNEDGAARAAADREMRERMTFALFQSELRQAYEVTLRRYRDSMDAIYASVEPTEEQRSAIRDLVIDHIRTTRLKATPPQRREVTLGIYRLLDEERRERLFVYLLRQVVPD